MMLRNSGKPELRCNPSIFAKLSREARSPDKRGHSRALSQPCLDCIFSSRAAIWLGVTEFANVECTKFSSNARALTESSQPTEHEYAATIQ
jgi:hypothetical protein